MGQTSTDDAEAKKAAAIAKKKAAAKKAAAKPPTKTKVGEPVVERLYPNLEIPELEGKTAVYWVGMTPLVKDMNSEEEERPPFASCTIAGITFPTAETPWEGGNPTNPNHERGYYPGTLVRLSEDQVSNLKSVLRRSLVRWRQRHGRHRHGYKVVLETEETLEAAQERWGLTKEQLISYRAKTMRQAARAGDEPLAKYLYCVKCPVGFEPGARARPAVEIPPSILERERIEMP